MQKQKFNPAINSVSLHFGPHIVHGHAEESAFGKVMQNMLLREINKTCGEMFEKMAGTPAAAPTSFDFSEVKASSILGSVQRWREMIARQEPVKEFEPCSVPDWMRPGLRAKGMTDEQIDKIIITAVEPSFEDVPGIVLRTVSS
ncbi:hypothetical protein MPK70_gp235 [Erwinia phage pEa_SNUABM_33]|uniref:Uncharacterized protein n=1 Tax=Erwinia phage pEa_SNUABM_33 TaxID=2869556 RepID=A0AAE7XMP2_9CAUD|nr:hypothetical protein MPK70_gp235 [Erwinia phage pEa_SNUABM_33]QZE58111.1 hypothetical protein pEaSNUABM33_00235 [Erwinia phage pEa_SNUABM_33]WAK44565.1 hypothetical protein [Erwinia phage vB_Ea_2910A]